MKRSRLIWSVLALTVGSASYLHAAAKPAQGGAAPAAASAAVDPAAATNGRAMLNQYCVTCHSDRLKTAGLSLEGLDTANVSAHADVWEKVIRKLRNNAMPPPGRPRPERTASLGFVKYLETAHDQAVAANPNPGRPSVHRLNRTEYVNAIRDLIGLEIDGKTLLVADDLDKDGFDNNAEVLSVSPASMERYMSAARKITREAIGRQSAAAVAVYKQPRLLYQDARMDEDLPFGSRGGMAIKHRFPVDGEYSIKIKLQTNLYDYIRGLGRPHQLEVRLDGTRLKTFTVGGEDKGRTAPSSYAGAMFGTPEWEDYSHVADKGLEMRFPAKAGQHIVGVAFVGDSAVALEGVLRPKQVGYPLAVNEQPDSNPAVDTVLIGGPYTTTGPGDTPVRRKIFTCTPSAPSAENACAEKILSTLARKAYRRPVTAADTQVLMGFYQSGRKAADFEAGIQLGLERILVDPEFLFRTERDPMGVAPGTAYRISDFELASRLSFFLWSSIPDDELLDLAAKNQLHEPKVLEAQVRRMLGERRTRESLVSNFAGQWLELRNVDSWVTNTDLFSEFDDNLRRAMRRETELFIDDQLTRDRPLLELLTANYTFLNQRLAEHYKIPNVIGERFRKVTLDASSPRVGLLGQASVLTVTSYPDRTSPVLRGKFLLSNILGAAPPPPPPNVPALKDKGKDGKPASVRERLEAHRANAVCATCHSQIDPLGFALENYDAIGMWRTSGEGGAPIDASSTLADGSPMVGPEGLRNFLASRKEQVVEAITEKLMAYALGRSIQADDYPAIRTVMRDSTANDHPWSSVILGIVKSVPFQMRRSEQ